MVAVGQVVRATSRPRKRFLVKRLWESPSLGMVADTLLLEGGMAGRMVTLPVGELRSDRKATRARREAVKAGDR